MADIVAMVEELIHTYHEVSNEHKKMFAQDQEVLGKCPNCGGQIAKGKYGAYCIDKCGMNVSRVMGVSLTDEQVKSMLSGKKILLKGLKSKKAASTMPILFQQIQKNTITQKTEKKNPVCSLNL